MENKISNRVEKWAMLMKFIHELLSTLNQTLKQQKYHFLDKNGNEIPPNIKTDDT